MASGNISRQAMIIATPISSEFDQVFFHNQASVWLPWPTVLIVSGSTIARAVSRA
jgi:hypothetical protein